MGTVATHALNPLMLKRKPYDAVTDFAPVSLLVVVPNVLVVNPEPAGKDRAGTDRAAEGRPGQVQLCVFRRRHAAAPLRRAVQEHGEGLDAAHRLSAAPAPRSTTWWPARCRSCSTICLRPPSSSGRARCAGIAVTTKERAPSFPDMPTIAEGGLARL